jgi:hypothetical protein
MATLGVQMQHDGIFTGYFTVVCALLTHGRAYADAVREFSPYREIKKRNPNVRAALRDILIRALRRGNGLHFCEQQIGGKRAHNHSRDSGRNGRGIVKTV